MYGHQSFLTKAPTWILSCDSYDMLRTPNLCNTVSSLFDITKLVSPKQASISPTSSLPSLIAILSLCHHEKHHFYYVCSLSHGYSISLLYKNIIKCFAWHTQIMCYRNLFRINSFMVLLCLFSYFEQVIASLSCFFYQICTVFFFLGRHWSDATSADKTFCWYKIL